MPPATSAICRSTVRCVIDANNRRTNVTFPAGGHRAGGALVSALRPVLPDVEAVARPNAASKSITSRLTGGYAPAEFIEAARPARHSCGSRWFVADSQVKVAGRWTYLFRAVDQHRQVIDVFVCERRDAVAARAFFARALTHGSSSVGHDRSGAGEPPGDRGSGPTARHVFDHYANNVASADHCRLKGRLHSPTGRRLTTARASTGEAQFHPPTR
jgi:transposase-like protein